MQILTPAAAPDIVPRQPTRAAPQLAVDAWQLLAWVGAAFFVMGIVDIALAWYPMGWGVPEWEFGALAATMNGFAVPMLGAYLFLGAAVARRKPVLARVSAIGMLLLALTFVVLAFMYVTVVPIALKATSESAPIHFGMKKAIVKAVLLFFVYIALSIAGAVKAWRSASRA